RQDAIGAASDSSRYRANLRSVRTIPTGGRVHDHEVPKSRTIRIDSAAAAPRDHAEVARSAQQLLNAGRPLLARRDLFKAVVRIEPPHLCNLDADRFTQKAKQRRRQRTHVRRTHVESPRADDEILRIRRLEDEHAVWRKRSMRGDQKLQVPWK